MKFILIFFILIQFNYYIICKFPDNRTRAHIEEIYSKKYLEFDEHLGMNKLYEKSKKYAFPNTIRFNNKGILFISVPRHLFGEFIQLWVSKLTSKEICIY